MAAADHDHDDDSVMLLETKGNIEMEQATLRYIHAVNDAGLAIEHIEEGMEFRMPSCASATDGAALKTKGNNDGTAFDDSIQVKAEDHQAGTCMIPMQHTDDMDILTAPTLLNKVKVGQFVVNELKSLVHDIADAVMECSIAFNAKVMHPNSLILSLERNGVEVSTVSVSGGVLELFKSSTMPSALISAVSAKASYVLYAAGIGTVRGATLTISSSATEVTPVVVETASLTFAGGYTTGISVPPESHFVRVNKGRLFNFHDGCFDMNEVETGHLWKFPPTRGEDGDVLQVTDRMAGTMQWSAFDWNASLPALPISAVCSMSAGKSSQTFPVNTESATPIGRVTLDEIIVGGNDRSKQVRAAVSFASGKVPDGNIYLYRENEVGSSRSSANVIANGTVMAVAVAPTEWTELVGSAGAVAAGASALSTYVLAVESASTEFEVLDASLTFIAS